MSLGLDFEARLSMRLADVVRVYLRFKCDNQMCGREKSYRFEVLELISWNVPCGEYMLTGF